MTISTGIPASERLPLFYVNIDGSQNVIPQFEQPALLIGQMLPGSNSVPGHPSVSDAAEPGKLILANNTDEVEGMCGRGSMIASMHRTFRKNELSGGSLYILPLADLNAGVKATKTLTVTGTASSSGILDLYIAGQRVRVPVSNGDDATSVATAIVGAVEELLSVIMQATSAAGVVTLTARHKGTLGNDLDVRLNYRGVSDGEIIPPGIAIAIAAGTSGTGDPDLAPALSTLGDEVYDFVTCPYTDTTSLDAIRVEFGPETGRWASDRLEYGHVFSSRRGTAGALTTFGDGRNDPHVSILGVWDSPTPPWDWAAGVTGSVANSLRADPALPVHTLPILGVLPPQIGSTGRFTKADRRTLLWSGISTFVTGSDGTPQIERLITTYQENRWGVSDPTFLDTETMFTSMYVFRRLKLLVTQKFGRVKLARDGIQAPNSSTVTPSIIKAALVADYAEMVSLGITEDVEGFEAHLVVEIDATDPNRVNVLYDADYVNQLRLFTVLGRPFLNFPRQAI